MQDAAVAEAITDESITFKGENIAANRVFHTKRFTNPKPSTPKKSCYLFRVRGLLSVRGSWRTRRRPATESSKLRQLCIENNDCTYYNFCCYAKP